MQIKESHGEVDFREPQTIDHKQRGRLRTGHRDRLGGAIEEQTSDAEIEKEFERIHVEENEEKQHAGEETRGAIVKSEAAAIPVMPIPDQREKKKAESESGKPRTWSRSNRQTSRNIEQDNEQGESRNRKPRR